MTEDTTNNYKITAQILIEIFPYQDADDEIPDYVCFKSLPDAKASLLAGLKILEMRVNKMTMKDIKQGVRW